LLISKFNSRYKGSPNPKLAKEFFPNKNEFPYPDSPSSPLSIQSKKLNDSRKKIPGM